MKKFIILFFVFFFFVFPSQIFAQKETAHVLFINQVRSEECCDQGSLENLKTQVQAFRENNIPAYFAIRYDALNDPQYSSYLKEISNENSFLKLGLLLEITPNLAKEAGVKYTASKDKWFEAQNIFSIGYNLEDNKKIVDLLFAKFKDIYGYYPELSSAWMIETKTLNYIHDTYGVKVHQITREQWNTDSYTIYGGPPHYPFPAGDQWLLIPDYERTDAPLIVRQTVTDPLYNYGDKTNSFTSQPNDYLQGKKDFTYFKKLIDQAIDQPDQTGFALLGLENSIEKSFQLEFVKQIEYVAQLREKKQIQFPELSKLTSYWSKNKTSVYWGKDFVNNSDNQAFWITTPSYRLRLIVKNDHVAIDDFRLFNKEFIDPYTLRPAKKEGFWIVPYLIDGSHWYQQNFNLNYGLENIFPEVANDKRTNTTQIQLPSKNNRGLNITKDSNKIVLKYFDQADKSLTITINPDSILFASFKQSGLVYQPFVPSLFPVKFIQQSSGFQLSWTIDNQTSYFLTNTCQKNSCEIKTHSSPDLIEKIRIKQYPFMFPEPISRKLSQEKSQLLIHNRSAIAGRNPVRIVFIPKDIYNVPITLDQPLEAISDSSLNIDSNVKDKIYFVDISSKNPIESSVLLKLNNKLVEKINFFFAPNCKKDFGYCLKHPQQFYWYLQTILGDKIRFYLHQEKQ